MNTIALPLAVGLFVTIKIVGTKSNGCYPIAIQWYFMSAELSWHFADAVWLLLLLSTISSVCQEIRLLLIVKCKRLSVTFVCVCPTQWSICAIVEYRDVASSDTITKIGAKSKVFRIGQRFDFAPSLFIVTPVSDFVYSGSTAVFGMTILPKSLTTSYKAVLSDTSSTLSEVYRYARTSSDGKTIYWYAYSKYNSSDWGWYDTDSSAPQLNESGTAYYWIAFG